MTDNSRNKENTILTDYQRGFQKSQFESAIRAGDHEKAYSITIDLLGDEMKNHIYYVIKGDWETGWSDLHEVYNQACEELSKGLVKYNEGYSHLRLFFFIIVHRILNKLGYIEGDIQGVRGDVNPNLREKVKQTVYTQASPKNVVENEARAKLARQAVAETLTNREIAIIDLRYTDRMTYPQIACVLAGEQLDAKAAKKLSPSIREEAHQSIKKLKAELRKRKLYPFNESEKGTSE